MQRMNASGPSYMSAYWKRNYKSKTTTDLKYRREPHVECREQNEIMGIEWVWYGSGRLVSRWFNFTLERAIIQPGIPLAFVQDEDISHLALSRAKDNNLWRCEIMTRLATSLNTIINIYPSNPKSHSPWLPPRPKPSPAPRRTPFLPPLLHPLPQTTRSVALCSG